MKLQIDTHFFLVWENGNREEFFFSRDIRTKASIEKFVQMKLMQKNIQMKFTIEDVQWVPYEGE